VLTIVTISSPEEAARAVDAGADVLVIQGPEAGGHRSIFDPGAGPPTAGLLTLLAQTADLGVPVVAAGGLGDSAAVRRALDAGAAAAQVGTALLLCEEAGTSEVHRRALRDDRFTDTVVTRAFSGRYARSLANAFTDRYSAAAPPGYPQLNQMTGPIRSAAAAAGDPQAVGMWAGTAWRGIRAGGAAQVVAALASEN
jgi:nitronate monooxygenase